jgi:hypothetical protein
MDLNQLLIGMVSKFLDSLKVSNRLLWLAIGALVIAAEAYLASPASPVKLPPGVITILSSLVLAFNNPRTSVKAGHVDKGDLKSDYGVVTAENGAPTPGDYLDSLIAKGIDSIKTKPGIYMIMMTILGAAKFVFTEGDLKLDEQVIIAVLSIVQFLMAPRTSGFLVTTKPMGPAPAPTLDTTKQLLPAHDNSDDSGNDSFTGIGGKL